MGDVLLCYVLHIDSYGTSVHVLSSGTKKRQAGAGNDMSFVINQVRWRMAASDWAGRGAVSDGPKGPRHAKPQLQREGFVGKRQRRSMIQYDSYYTAR